MKRLRWAGVFLLCASIASAGTTGVPKRSVSELTPSAVSVIREAISDQVANYALLIDGDGVNRDPRAWADQLWTEDAIFQVYDAQGRSIFGNDVGLRGREAIFAAFGRALPPGDHLRTRHLFLELRFDLVQRNLVRLRRVGYITYGRGDPMAKDSVDAMRPSAYVYHDEWVPGRDGVWRMRRETVYCSFNCIPAPPTGKTPASG